MPRPELSGVVEDRQHLLHPAEGEHGDQERAALLDRVVYRLDQADHLGRAGLLGLAQGRAARRLGDQGVEVAGGEARAWQGALVLEKDVSGEEDRAVPVAYLEPGRAGHMARGVQDDLDLVPAAAELFRVAEGDPGQALGDPVDLLVREERVVQYVLVLALAHHDARGVVQHALDQHAARGRHDDRGRGMLAHGDRQAADMVEVAVRDDDQVDRLAPQRRVVRRGLAARLLGVQPRVHKDVEVTELDEQRVGAYAAVAVQVNELHSFGVIIGRGAGPVQARPARRAPRDVSLARDDELERGEQHVHLGAVLVGAVEAAEHAGVAPGDVVAVV
jgi:hypothetical protein